MCSSVKKSGIRGGRPLTKLTHQSVNSFMLLPILINNWLEDFEWYKSVTFHAYFASFYCNLVYDQRDHKTLILGSSLKPEDPEGIEGKR
ncbi:unnamed protein product [Brugia timori]|uniref:Ovule protein n=1 Tax=Brugia timori TaxID=42155 RepID=A0A0R3QL58_9BILA|nr:unnamed protein product [Brugia timori]